MSSPLFEMTRGTGLRTRTSVVREQATPIVIANLLKILASATGRHKTIIFIEDIEKAYRRGVIATDQFPIGARPASYNGGSGLRYFS
jgi:hypothetical protein